MTKLALGVIALAVSAGTAAAQSFTILPLPNGAVDSEVWGLSGNGQAIAGSGTVGPQTRAIKWQGGTGSVLPVLPGGTYGQAQAASYDGSTVVGWGNTSTASSLGWRYRAGVLTSIGDLPGGEQFSAAGGVSRDGNVIVGTSTSSLGTEAIRWTEQGGLTPLGDLPGGSYYSAASGVSADGSILCGYGTVSGNSRRAIRWVGNQLQQLDSLMTAGEAFANAISPDGSVIVGYSQAVGGAQAAMWVNGVVSPLGRFGPASTTALALTPDASIIVGATANGSGDIALLHDASGWHSIADMLQGQYGLNLGGLMLREAWGISEDGLTIVGRGQDSQGHTRGWVATIPAPGTAVVLMGLCVGAARRRR